MTVGNSAQLMEDTRRNVDLIVRQIESGDFAVPTALHPNVRDSCYSLTHCAGTVPWTPATSIVVWRGWKQSPGPRPDISRQKLIAGESMLSHP